MTQSTTATRTDLHAALHEDWDFWMQQYPELATQFGYPGQNSRWTDYSAPAIAFREQYLRRSLQRWTAIETADLAADDRLTVELYVELIQTAVDGLEFGNDALPFRGVIPHNLRAPMNQIEGVAQDIPLALSLMPATRVSEYDDIIARLEGVSALIDQTIALMAQGLAGGVTPPGVALRAVPAQVRAQADATSGDSPLLEAFRRFPGTLADADRTRLRARAAAAFDTYTRPAFSRLLTFLEETYLPSCREETAVSALPRGAEQYAYNIRWHTTLSLTPAEIHAMGQTAVRRLGTAMDEVRTSAGFTGGAAEFADFLRTDSRFFFADANALLFTYRDIAKRADSALAPLFRRLPQTPYGVLAVPDATAPAQVTAYYQPGSLATGRAGQMFANTSRLETRPRWEMEALTLHEAVPGHHLQISLAQEMVGLPEFRKHSSYTAYVEGWALYSESLGADMGFYVDPYARYGQLTYEIWRAARLVVDTGLHALGWSRQQAIDFLLTHTPKALSDIIVEVDRYIVWPGQALGYKIGEIKIAELRARAEHELGERFDIRAFHDVLLGAGALPLGILERRVVDWIDDCRRAG